MAASTSTAAINGATTDLDPNAEISALLLPHLDRHLALPILHFLEEHNVYPKEEILAAKYELLRPTNMIHYTESVRKEIENDNSDGLSEAASKKAEEIIKRRDELKEKADKVIEIISNPQVAAALGQDKERNLTTLREKYNLEVDQIDNLYQYGQYSYSLGDYAAASDYLNSFRILSIDPTLTLSAYWGKLVSNILEEPLEGEEKTYDGALEELKLLKDDIESARNSRSPSAQLQQRTAWLHWSLMVYFKIGGVKGMQLLVEHWTESALEAGEKRRYYYLDAIQSGCPWLMRYLVTAIVVSHQGPIKINTYSSNNPSQQGKKSILSPKIYQVLRIVESEKYQYSDVITEFFRLLIGTVDFEGATACLKKANEKVLEEDYFTSHVKSEFVDRARHFMSEVYCRIHHKIDITDLSSRLGLTADEGERWIVELVRDARLDAKIDLQRNIVTMNKPTTSIHQTISDRAKQLLERAQYILPQSATSSGIQEGGKSYNKQGRGERSHGAGQGQTPRPVEIKS